MKLKKTHIKRTIVEEEITLPYYGREAVMVFPRHIKIESENRVISVTSYSEKSGTVTVTENVLDANYEEITESEFAAEFAKAMKIINNLQTNG